MLIGESENYKTWYNETNCELLNYKMVFNQKIMRINLVTNFQLGNTNCESENYKTCTMKLQRWMYKFLTCVQSAFPVSLERISYSNQKYPSPKTKELQPTERTCNRRVLSSHATIIKFRNKIHALVQWKYRYDFLLVLMNQLFHDSSSKQRKFRRLFDKLSNWCASHVSHIRKETILLINS